MKVKKCSQCDEEKSVVFFHKNKSRFDGLSTYCATCSNKLAREHNKKESTKTYRRVYSRNFKKTPKGRATSLYDNAKARARDNNLDFDLDIPWITEKIETGICEATKLPFVLETSGKSGISNMKAWAPTLDKVNPKEGYTKENVKLVCWIYNRAKGVDNEETLRIMARALLDAE